MPRRPTRTVPTVILHGWHACGPGHWQSWLAEQLRATNREVRFPVLPNPDDPSLPDWLTALDTALVGLADDAFDVVAHSLGAVLWLHHAAVGRGPRPARVALVSPPSPHTTIPEIAGFFPPPLDIDIVRRAADGTVLVAGDDDPYLPEGIAAAYGLPLKMAATIISGAGHLNLDAGYGEWPGMLDWCGRDNLAFIA